MPRRPEIGNIQLYPNRPLRASDRNGFVLKFYCPIVGKRVRKNCGTRDRREARRVLQECRERLLNGQYVDSGGAISANQTKAVQSKSVSVQMAPASANGTERGLSWQDCYDRYRQFRKSRTRKPRSLGDAMSRLQIAERIFEADRQERKLPEGLFVRECLSLERLEFLQERLLDGDECRYDRRSPNTVNSMVAAVMAFTRHCEQHGWITAVPKLQKLEVEEVMKGRPITGEELERMLDVTPKIVGQSVASSWQFALRILWESGFRVGDLMNFSWDDERHIHPVWPKRQGQHATVVIPSSQKNGRVQEIPLLPGLNAVLMTVPEKDRTGWIANPQPIEYELPKQSEWFRPTEGDLRELIRNYSNRSIALACGVSDMAVRKWLATAKLMRTAEFHRDTGEIRPDKVQQLRDRSVRSSGHKAQRNTERLTKERVSRLIALIGEEAKIIVRQANPDLGQRVKHASAHDLRRGCAQRLINLGVSAETLKVIMRHADFATTEKFYGAMRSAQAAATEVHSKLTVSPENPSFVGGLVGGIKTAPQFNAEELSKLKSLLDSL
ncbi:MAG: site-specific integrase [Candidatus Saccharimonas sp.]|nr:site-specific integrase [Planctomycetaceae bacterium]